MAKHQLSLDIPDTITSCVMRIIDTSTYDGNITPECLTLTITPPGFTVASTLTGYTPGFIANITACDLGIQTSNCATTRSDLADGVYVVKYSIAPAEYVYVEYNHLRITAALNKIQSLLCCLDVAACEPQGQVREELREVQLLSTMLQAAKAKVEYCHNPNQGMAMYNYVNSRLTKLMGGCSCTDC
jgi:hypothetical protein